MKSISHHSLPTSPPPPPPLRKRYRFTAGLKRRICFPFPACQPGFEPSPSAPQPSVSNHLNMAPISGVKIPYYESKLVNDTHTDKSEINLKPKVTSHFLMENIFKNNSSTNIKKIQHVFITVLSIYCLYIYASVLTCTKCLNCTCAYTGG